VRSCSPGAQIPAQRPALVIDLIKYLFGRKTFV